MPNYSTQFALDLTDRSDGMVAWCKRSLASREGNDAKYFDHRFEDYGNDKALLKVYAEDGSGSSLDQAVEFVQAFIKRWRPGAVEILSYAFTCSAMLSGAFGGGAWRITDKKALVFDAVNLAVGYREEKDV